MFDFSRDLKSCCQTGSDLFLKPGSGSILISKPNPDPIKKHTDPAGFKSATLVKGTLKSKHRRLRLKIFAHKYHKEKDLKNLYFHFCILGCITAEELKFVLTHLPGKVKISQRDKTHIYQIRILSQNGL